MLIFEGDRPSDSPCVERVWRYHSEGSGSFFSIAECRSEMVVAWHEGRVTVTVRGPETRATRLPYPPDAEWLGIRLKPGAFRPGLPGPGTRERRCDSTRGHARLVLARRLGLAVA
jgi:hypothetical protein